MHHLSNYRHVMVDMETLDVSNSPVCFSLSAVTFYIEKKMSRNELLRVDNTFHTAIDIDSQIKNGLTVRNGALLFNIKNNNDFLEKCLSGCGISLLSPYDALVNFQKYIKEINNTNVKNTKTLVWANGAISDHVWLDSLYSKYELENPIPYSDRMCFRTMRESFPDAFTLYSNDHDSLKDAANQAISMMNAYSFVTGNKNE